MTGRLRITLGDGEPPSLTPDLVERIHRELEEDQSSRLVTIEGIPGSFCEGGDLEFLSSPAAREEENDPVARFAALLSAIEKTPRPVIALVDGSARGGGVGLIAAADLVLATSRSSFALPETLIGLFPAAVFPVLARRVGVGAARLLALGRAPLSAEEALQIGLIDEIVDDLVSALDRHCRRFLRLEPRAVGAMKDLVAIHYSSAGYLEDASRRFRELLGCEETRARLQRMARGDPPWMEETP